MAVDTAKGLEPECLHESTTENLSITEDSSQLESFQIAAKKTNGTFKEVIFKKFLNIATEFLGTLKIPYSRELSLGGCEGSFPCEVLEMSTEEEQIKLASFVQDNTIRKLFEVICLIWSKEISLSAESFVQVLALFRLFLLSYKYRASQESHKNFKKLISVMEIFFEEEDAIKNMEKDSGTTHLLQYCLEYVCLHVDHSSTTTGMQSKYLRLICNSPSKCISLLSKAIAGFVSEENYHTLGTEELEHFVNVLKSGKGSSQSFAECTVPSVLRGLMKNEYNREMLMQYQIEENSSCDTAAVQQKLCGMRLNVETQDMSALPCKSSGELSDEDTQGSEPLPLHERPDLTVYESSIVEMVDYLAKFFIKSISGELPLHTAELANSMASLLLIEQLLSGANERKRKEIKHILSQLPNFAKCATQVLKDDLGAVHVHVLRSVAIMMMALTDCSQDVCTELSLAGFVAYLIALLSSLDKSAVFGEGTAALIMYVLMILLNCAKYPPNLPVYEAADAAETIISYVECPIFHISFLGKMVLGFLKPHLANEQFEYLALDEEVSPYLVELFSDAVKSPDMTAEGNSLEEILQFLVNFTQPSWNNTNERQVTDPKSKKNAKPSQFSLIYKKRKDLIGSNIQKVVENGILPHMEELLLKSNLCPLVIESCLLLAWNLLHSESAMTEISRECLRGLPGLSSGSATANSLIMCIQWLLGDIDKNSISLGVIYANTCYKYNNFEDCVSVCRHVKGQILPESSADEREINLLIGKALYHTSQPELWHLIKRGDSLMEKEIRLVSHECSVKMKEAIFYLGSSLDNKHIDSEGSRLLDYALNASTLDLGYPGTRCLLCRRGGQKLKKSHLWPNFVLERIYRAELAGITKPFLFDNKPKFGKGCTFHMFCQRCEAMLSQNGEDQFARLLDSFQRAPDDEHSYGNCLYDFAVGILFRVLTTESMSYVVNEQELYHTFLLCRKHLFTLPTKIGSCLYPPLSEEESYNLCEDATTGSSDLSIYVMRSMAKQASSKDEMIHFFGEYCYCAGTVATCHLGNAKLDLSGRVHFLQVYLNGFHFLVKLKASESFPIGTNFMIQQQPSSKCFLPKEDVNSVPEGMWSVFRQLGSMVFNQRMSFYETISDLALSSLVKTESSAFSEQLDLKPQIDPLVIDEVDASILDNSTSLNLPAIYRFNLLPKDFFIDRTKPSELPLQLPKSHKIVLHLSGKSGDLLMTYFLCTNRSPDTQSFYLIFVYSDESGSGLQIMDGVHITSEDVPVVTSFLFEDRPRMEKLPHPFSIETMQVLIDRQLPSLLYSKGIKSMKQLIHLLHCRSESTPTDCVPSLDTKCQPDGCWYCSNLCLYCMHPVPLWSTSDAAKPPLKFCGENCRELIQLKAGSSPKISATYNQKKPGKIVGPAKLEITKSVLLPGATFSKVEYIQLCIGDGQETGISVETPYVLWQVRTVTSQNFMDFVINDNFEPLACLWTSGNSGLNISLTDAPVKTQVTQLVRNILALVLEKIGYKTLNSFVADN